MQARRQCRSREIVSDIRKANAERVPAVSIRQPVYQRCHTRFICNYLHLARQITRRQQSRGLDDVDCTERGIEIQGLSNETPDRLI